MVLHKNGWTAKHEKNPFNSKRKIAEAMTEVIDACTSPYLLVSFNNEGYLHRTEIEEMLSKKGVIETFSIDHPRYVGAKIGIFNPKANELERLAIRKTRNCFLWSLLMLTYWSPSAKR